MNVFAWKAGALLTTVGIGAGAFGAHSLASRLEKIPNGKVNWSMASQYCLFNGIGLLAISQHPRLNASRFKYAPVAILAGTMIFSGSIFSLLLYRDQPIVSKIAGPATPLGGLAMIAGYLALVL